MSLDRESPEAMDILPTKALIRRMPSPEVTEKYRLELTWSNM
jgi:hypothetical protein